MTEFDKYQRNVMRAEAVQEIGSKLLYWIDDTEDDIKSYEKRIEDRIAESKATDSDYDPDGDWQVRSWYSTAETAKEKKSIYLMLQRCLDKELTF